MSGSRPALSSAAPSLVALIGLVVPLAGGRGAGWAYVVGWVIALVGMFLLKFALDAPGLRRQGVTLRTLQGSPCAKPGAPNPGA